MLAQANDYQNYPWTAHDMGGWSAEVTGVKAAKIDRPTIFTHWAFPFLVRMPLCKACQDQSQNEIAWGCPSAGDCCKHAPVQVLGVLAGGGAVAYKLYYSPFMKIPAIWAAGIIFVYFFSVSGGMHNIIRGVPMQHLDQRTGKVGTRWHTCNPIAATLLSTRDVSGTQALHRRPNCLCRWCCSSKLGSRNWGQKASSWGRCTPQWGCLWRS